MSGPRSVRGPDPRWPFNKLARALAAAGSDPLDPKPNRDGQAQTFVTNCPGPAHAPCSAGGGTRELLISEYPTGLVRMFCFKRDDVRMVLEHYGLSTHDLTTGPDGSRLDEVEPEVVDPPIPLPDYPAGLLPGPLRELVTAGTKAGLPAELVAGAGLGVAATLNMPAEISVYKDRDTWQEPSTLWIPLVAPTGGGKTPAILLARSRLDELERDAHDTHGLELEAWRLRKEEGDEEAGSPPTLRRLTVDDVTQEAFFVALAANAGRLAVLVDELRTHLHSMGRYRQSGGRAQDEARWLGLWAGRVVQYERKTGGQYLRVDRPVAPILGGLQPSYLLDLGDNESGSRARWLLHYSPAAFLDTDAAVKATAWTDYVDLAYTVSTGWLWWLDEATRKVWTNAQRGWRSLARRGDTPPAVVSSAAKAAAQSLRVAVNCAELLDVGRGGPIPPEAMVAAIAVVDYSLGVWAALGGAAETLSTSRREEVYSAAVDRFAAWIETKGGRVTRRDVLLAKPCGIRTAEKLDAVLVEYRKTYPGTVRDETPPGGGTTTQAIYAPRDPRVYAVRGRSNPPHTPLFSNGVDSVNTVLQEEGERQDRDPSPQVSGTTWGYEEDHSGVDTPTVDTGVDTVLSTPSRSSYVESLFSNTYTDDPDTAPPTTDSDHIEVRETFTADPVPIDSADAWQRVLPEILAAPSVGLDLETTGLDPNTHRARLAQLATRPDTAYVVDLDRIPVTALQPVLDHNVMLGFHLNFDLRFLAAGGCCMPKDLGPRVRCLQLAEQVLTASTAHRPKGYFSLTEVAERRLKIRLDKTEQGSDWSGELDTKQLRYAAADAAVLLPLRDNLAGHLREADLLRVADLENRCLPAMVWLAHTGAPFDTSRLAGLTETARRDLADADREVHRAAGREVNANSPKQLLELFAELGVEIDSTAETTLEQVDHPLARAVLDHRHAARMVSMYGEQFAQFVSTATGRIHASWHQVGSRAGRMSCGEPNLQQVPKARPYRECFRPAPGRLLVRADYSQIELRVAAAVARDRKLLEAFKSGEDLHTLTARKVLGRTEVTAADRQAAKAVNFGLLYGMGADRLVRHAATTYGVTMSEEEAKKYRRAFFTTYPGLRRWHKSQPEGRVGTRTLTGRRRLGVVKYTEKLNTPVQGTAADGMKAALALLFERKDDFSQAGPVLVVHDEIVLETPAGSAAEAADWLRTAMVDGMQSVVPEVPVEVETDIADSWAGP